MPTPFILGDTWECRGRPVAKGRICEGCEPLSKKSLVHKSVSWPAWCPVLPWNMEKMRYETCVGQWGEADDKCTVKPLFLRIYIKMGQVKNRSLQWHQSHPGRFSKHSTQQPSQTILLPGFGDRAPSCILLSEGVLPPLSDVYKNGSSSLFEC